MRSLLIAIALLLPVVFIVMLSNKIKPAPAMYHDNKKAAQITSKVKPAPIADERLPMKINPGSLEEARWRLRKRLDELGKMTEKEWQEQKQARQNFGKKWDTLSDKQKLEAIEKMQQKKHAPSRAPEIDPAPASPPSDKF